MTSLKTDAYRISVMAAGVLGVLAAGLAPAGAQQQPQIPKGWFKACAKQEDVDICNVQNILTANTGQVITGISLLELKGKVNRKVFQVTVPTGRLEPVRDLLDVRDVVEAYLALLRAGEPGEVYNVSRGEGSSLRELFDRLAELVGVRVEPAVDPSLARANDISHLVGDSTKLRRATGWAPSRSLEQTLRGLVDAEAD